MARSRLLS